MCLLVPLGYEGREVGPGPACAAGAGPAAWSHLEMRVTTSRMASSRVARVLACLTPAGGGTDSCLTAVLRHPYEDWTARFSHHVRRYTVSETLLVVELFGQASGAGAAQRLGDPRWLENAVGRLAPQRPRPYRAARDAVAQVLEG